MRQRQYMELLKDYNCTIKYLPCKANAMTYALRRKAIGSVVYMQTIYYPLLSTLREIQVRLNKDYSRTLLASFQVCLLLVDWVKEAQCHNLQLMKVKGEVDQGLRTNFSI